MNAILKKVFKFILQMLFAAFEAETNLILMLVSEAEALGLSGEEARKHVLREFRKNYRGELRDSLLNFLVEAVVVSTKE